MGKATLVYVIGLSLIIGLALNNINQNSVSSVDTFTTYYGTTQVHNIALAGANIGTNRLLSLGGSSSVPPAFSIAFFGGQSAVTYAADVPKPLWVTLRSVAWTSMTDKYGLIFRDTVEAVFKHVQFAKYSWFTEKEANGYLAPNGSKGPYYGSTDYKITGDSIFGPAHTNGRFNLDGTPYFDQKVTAALTPNLGPTANPVYNGGYEWGITKTRPNTVKLESSITNAATAGVPPGFYYDASTNGNKDVGLTFQNTNVRVQIPPTGGGTDTTMPISSFAPNGLIVVKNGDLRIKGTYSGAVTVAAFSGTSGTSVNKGNVWIDGSVVGNTNPVSNPSSTDMLGIVAGRMAYISKDLTRTPSSVVDIQAAVYVQNGELTAEEFWNIPVSGRVNLFGGVTQVSAGSLGIYNPGPPLTFLNGYKYSIRNDPRYETRQPPFFPYSDSFEMVAWWEN